MNKQRERIRYFDCTGLDIGVAEGWGEAFACAQRDVMWSLGDLARYAEHRWSETHHQIWPAWISPGLLARAKAVSAAYPKEEDRRHECTWTQYMQVANKPNRHELLDAMEGKTTDETRKEIAAENGGSNRPRWLLAFDIHYFAHRHFYSGAGVETALQVTEWVKRTFARLAEKGATDCVCAFEGQGNFRRELTKSESWDGEDYKDRPPKPEDLKHQLQLTRDLLEKEGFLCVSIDMYEADDVLASYATQFDGKTTIITADKDLRQVLSSNVNMLLDVEWIEDETSGQMLPEYKWLSAKQHTEATGIRPDQFVSLQALQGDSVDNIKGAIGIGAKGAADLIKEFGTCEAAIAAAKAGDERIKPKKREALIEFESKLEVTRQLVTLRTDLPIPRNTKI